MFAEVQLEAYFRACPGDKLIRKIIRTEADTAICCDLCNVRKACPGTRKCAAATLTPLNTIIAADALLAGLIPQSAGQRH